MRTSPLRTLVLIVFCCGGCKDLRPVEPEAKRAPDLRAARPDLPRARPRPSPPPAPTPAPTVGTSRPLKLPCEPPMLVGAGDLDGKRGPELVVACEDALLVLDKRGEVLARTTAEGWPQVLLVADLSGRAGEVLVGWGTSRKRPRAPARLLRYTLEGRSLEGKVVLEPLTSRPQFADLALETPGPSFSLLVAHFANKYMVRHLRLRPDGEKLREEEVGTWRMAMSLAPVSVPGKGAVLVGRLYGDALGLDGDAFVWYQGKKLPVPTTRGVSSVASGDVDGDGKGELLLCDGWAQRYADEGRALLTEARWQGGAFKTRLLLQLPGEYNIGEVQVVDANGDGKPELLVRGSTTLQLFHRRGEAWNGSLLSRNASDAVAVDLDGDRRAEVVVVGREPAVITLPAD